MKLTRKIGITTTLFVTMSVLPACAATQAETCSAMEDVGLAVLQGKLAGLDEPTIRRQLQAEKDSPLYNMVTRIFSSDIATKEYVLADARLQCTIMFMFDQDDGSRLRPGADLEPGLPPEEWLLNCTQSDWIEDWRKARGDGTMIKDWNAHSDEAVALIAFAWKHRDRVDDMSRGIETVLAAIEGGPTAFQNGIGPSVSTCVKERLINNPSERPSKSDPSVQTGNIYGLSNAECAWLIEAWDNKRSVEAIHKYGAPTRKYLDACRDDAR